jgi:predicted dehydrogenase
MSKLRLIQCGTGGMGKAWYVNATGGSPDFELVAIVDVAEAALSAAGEALKIDPQRRFRSLEAALDSVDAVAVLTVTPPAVHVEHAKLAFARGLHVLTEKPIAHDLPSARLMVELAQRAGRQLMVAQNYRYSAPMRRLATLAREMPLGQIGHGHIDFYIPADFTGSFRESMRHVLLVDMAIHHLDLIRAVMGRNITAVTAQTFNPPWSWYQHGAGLKMLLELEDGIRFSYSGDWSAFGRFTSWNGNWRLQCAGGSIHLENDAIALARCEKWNKDLKVEPTEVPPVSWKNGQAALLERFARSIRSNEPAETSGADNLWSFGAVMAGVQSAEEDGRRIEVAPLLQTTR